MRREWTVILVAMLLMALLPAVASASQVSGIYVNGSKLDAGGPVQVKSATYIPLDVVTAHLHVSGQLASVGDKRYFQPSSVSARAELVEVDKSYYVAVRFLADELGMKFTRDSLTGSVYLFDKVASPPTPEKPVQPDPAPQAPVSEQPAQQPGNEETGGRQPGDSGSPPSTNTPSGTVANVYTIVSSGDSLVLQADRPLQPTAFYLSNPHRIVLDVPYSQLADSSGAAAPAAQSGVLVSDHPYIEQIRYALFSNEPSTLRFVVDLKQNMPYELTADESGKVTLRIAYGTFRVAIDAGHGGHDPGSPGASMGEEKLFTLSLSQKVYNLLMKDQEIVPFMLRSDDTYISPLDRALRANEADIDLFVSIHANSFTNASIRGTETYYHHEHSERLAEIMHEHILAATGFPDREVRQKNYLVTKETTMPSVLLEIGYLSNPQEEAQLQSEAMQNKVAEAIVKGIKQFIKERGSSLR